jgi:hypothetical protein
MLIESGRFLTKSFSLLSSAKDWLKYLNPARRVA